MPGASRPRLDRFLAGVGVLLVVAAIVLAAVERSEALVVAFATLGVFTCVLAAFASRLGGEQSLTREGLQINIAPVAQVVEELEHELESRDTLDELPAPARTTILLSERVTRRLDEFDPDLRRRLVAELRAALSDDAVESRLTVKVPGWPEYTSTPLGDDYEALVRPLTQEELERHGVADGRRGYGVADITPTGAAA